MYGFSPNSSVAPLNILGLLMRRYWQNHDFDNLHFIWPFYITAQTDQIEIKIDSTLAKVEGLMAKSGEIENRFNEVDNIHQEIKGGMIKSK